MMDDNLVAVVALDRYSDAIRTVTACDTENSQTLARYYRGIGYRAKVVDYDTLDEMIEEERNRMYMHREGVLK